MQVDSKFNGCIEALLGSWFKYFLTACYSSVINFIYKINEFFKNLLAHPLVNNRKRSLNKTLGLLWTVALCSFYSLHFFICSPLNCGREAWKIWTIKNLKASCFPIFSQSFSFSTFMHTTEAYSQYLHEKIKCCVALLWNLFLCVNI